MIMQICAMSYLTSIRSLQQRHVATNYIATSSGELSNHEYLGLSSLHAKLVLKNCPTMLMARRPQVRCPVPRIIIAQR